MIRFVWYDILSNDHDAAIAFYERVMDWTGIDSGLVDRRFTVLTSGEQMVAGVTDLANVLEPAAARPQWLGYLAVGNVDMYTSYVEKAGGKILRRPGDIPQVGRFSIVADPQGAIFGLFNNPQVLKMAPALAEADRPGRVVRQELRSLNEERAGMFYAETFQWSNGIDTRLSPQAKAAWVYGFRTDDLEAALERVREAGGAVTGIAATLASGETMQTCTDPEGGTFALIALP